VATQRVRGKSLGAILVEFCQELLKGSNKDGIVGYREYIKRKGNYTEWEKLPEVRG
jgi:hypothetical protein